MAAPDARPPYDPELGVMLSQLMLPTNITLEILPMMRESLNNTATAAIVLANKPVTHSERVIPGPHGDITISIVQPNEVTRPSSGHPCIFFIHGGGMVCGNRFLALNLVADWAVETQAVVVAVEYRYAPEHPHPVPLEECYAALKWVSTNAAELGINPKRLLLSGQSAGGGLAAAAALYARDHEGPALCGQVLMCPMLDDRNESTSSKQFVNEGTWSRGSNLFSWDCYLDGKRGSDDVSIYAAPARAEDLSNLPPTYIDVGSAEVFRDEDVLYATRLWACGNQTELHVWPGGFHGFDLLAPHTKIGAIAIQTRTEWVKKILLL